MQKAIKHTLFFLFISISLIGQKEKNNKGPINWLTLEEADSLYKIQKRPTFIDVFTDWCGWCKKLVKEVYKTSEFNKWAKKNVVLVEVDFPRRTKLSDKVTKQNKELQQMFGVRGYPTVWFVTPEKGDNGQVNLQKIGSTGYVAGGPTKWIAAANIEISKKK